MTGRDPKSAHAQNSLANDVEARIIARGTQVSEPVVDLVNEAALLAARKGRRCPWVNLRKPRIKL